MRILLVDPPFHRIMGYYNMSFPLGLACLAAVLQKSGHKALVYDANCHTNATKRDFSQLKYDYPIFIKSLKEDRHPVWREVRQKIQDFAPDIVGITVLTPFLASSFKTASIVKNINKDLPVIMGGPHITIKYDEVMKICSDVDFLVRGEGERTFLELVEAIKSRDNDDHLKNIKGISFRRGNQNFHNPGRDFIKNLDDVTFPARNLLMNKHSYNSEDMEMMVSTMGCPYSCIFCASRIWERKTRYRSVDNIIEEMKLIKDNYGTTQFNFKDDLFTVNRKE